MKLNLDFALYKGKTRLREWWKAVKAHFTAVQDAVNELDTAITNEADARELADKQLTSNVRTAIRLESEKLSKLIQETELLIDDETKALQAADKNLQQTITDEAAARANADRDLGERINEVSNVVTGLDRELGDIKSDFQTASDDIDTLSDEIKADISDLQGASHARQQGRYRHHNR